MKKDDLQNVRRGWLFVRSFVPFVFFCILANRLWNLVLLAHVPQRFGQSDLDCAYRYDLYDGAPFSDAESHTHFGGAPFVHVFLQFPEDEGLPEVRRLEYMRALHCNALHPAVKKIHLLQEHALSPYVLNGISGGMGKIQVEIIGRRIHYKDAAEAMNRLPENSIAVLTNADIYLGDGFSFSVLDSSVSSHVGFALSRYEDSTCTTLRRGRGFCDCRMYDNCHDSYVFRSPLPHSLVQGNTTDFRFGGLWGSERVFVHELQAHGITLRNACFFVRTHHVHCSKLRPNQDMRWLNRELAIPESSSRVPPETALWKVYKM